MPEEQLLMPGLLPEDEAEDAVCNCPECGNDFPAEDGIVPGDHDAPHCPDCVHTCEGCENTFGDSYAIVVVAGFSRRSRYTGQCLCENCRFECDDCNGTFAIAEAEYQNSINNRICGGCAESYYTCESCSCLIHFDSANSTDDGTFCDSCYSERETESEDEADDTYLHDYSFKPAPEYALVPGESGALVPLFGVEVEVDSMESWRRRDLSKHIEATNFPVQWYCKSDGSLNNGFEAVSHPASWKYWQTADLGWMDRTRKAGFRSYDTSTCGMHVHVSRSFLTTLDGYKLLVMMRDNQTLFRRLSRRTHGQSSNLEHYAKLPSSPRLASKLVAVDHRSDGTKRVHKREWDDRYSAINFQNRHTVEFRLFRGTLNPASFRRNIALVVALCHYVKWAGFSQLTDTHFRVWCKVRGAAILGKASAKELSNWLNEVRISEPSADCAA